MATAKQRLQLSRARRDAFIGLGELIESEEMPDVSRVRLRMGFVAIALACKSTEAIKILCIKVNGFQDALETVSILFDQQAADDPQHFIHAILANAGANDNGESIESDVASGNDNDQTASE
jgi:hypothetical protein